MYQVLVLMLVAILLGVYNGQFLTGASKSWHRTGWLIRFLLGVLLYPNLLAMVVYAWLAWVAYDIIINFFIRQPWDYVGETSAIDKLPDWVDKTLKGVKIALTILMIVLIILA